MAIGGLVRSYGNRYYRKPIITGKLRWQGPMTVEMWRYAQGLTDKPVKGMLTGPYTMVDWSFDEYYDVAPGGGAGHGAGIHQEAVELEKAGARYIQVDEPAASTRPEEMDLVSQALGHRHPGAEGQDHHPHLLRRLRARLPPDRQPARGPARHRDGQQRLRPAGALPPADRFDKELAMGVVDVHYRTSSRRWRR